MMIEEMKSNFKMIIRNKLRDITYLFYNTTKIKYFSMDLRYSSYHAIKKNN
jgi:hypothetical protein